MRGAPGTGSGRRARERCRPARCLDRDQGGAGRRRHPCERELGRGRSSATVPANAWSSAGDAARWTAPARTSVNAARESCRREATPAAVSARRRPARSAIPAATTSPASASSRTIGACSAPSGRCSRCGRRNSSLTESHAAASRRRSVRAVGGPSPDVRRRPLRARPARVRSRLPARRSRARALNVSAAFRPAATDPVPAQETQPTLSGAPARRAGKASLSTTGDGSPASERSRRRAPRRPAVDAGDAEGGPGDWRAPRRLCRARADRRPERLARLLDGDCLPVAGRAALEGVDGSLGVAEAGGVVFVAPASRPRKSSALTRALAARGSPRDSSASAIDNAVRPGSHAAGSNPRPQRATKSCICASYISIPPCSYSGGG